MELNQMTFKGYLNVYNHLMKSYGWAVLCYIKGDNHKLDCFKDCAKNLLSNMDNVSFSSTDKKRDIITITEDIIKLLQATDSLNSAQYVLKYNLEDYKFTSDISLRCIHSKIFEKYEHKIEMFADITLKKFRGADTTWYCGALYNLIDCVHYNQNTITSPDKYNDYLIIINNLALMEKAHEALYNL